MKKKKQIRLMNLESDRVLIEIENLKETMKMGCKTCEQWRLLYEEMKKRAERDREVARELSLELDRLRDRRENEL